MKVLLDTNKKLEKLSKNITLLSKSIAYIIHLYYLCSGNKRNNNINHWSYEGNSRNISFW